MVMLIVRGDGIVISVQIYRTTEPQKAGNSLIARETISTTYILMQQSSAHEARGVHLSKQAKYMN